MTGWAGVLQMAWRLWWRKLVHAVGRGVSVTVIVLCVGSFVVFWSWVWPLAKESVAGLVTSDRSIAGMVLAGLLLSVCVVATVVRVAMLAFDQVSRDLRLLLHVAPLPKTARAAVLVVSDFATSLALTGLLGTAGILAFASISIELSIAEVAIGVAALVALVGAVAATIEWALTRATKDNMAARGGAAIATLGVVCGLLVAVTRSLSSGVPDGPVSAVGSAILAWPAVWGCAVSMIVLVAALSLWLFAATRVTHELFRPAWMTPILKVRSGSVSASAAATFGRDAGNRMGAISAVVLVALAVWTHVATGLPVGGVAAASALVAIVGATALLADGDYGAIRWRASVSPADSRLVIAGWLAGYLAIPVALGVSGLVVLGLARSDLFAGWGWTEADGLLAALLLALGSGVVAGRIVPADREELLTLAGSGVLAATICAALWWGTTRLIELYAVPRSALSLLFAAIGVGWVVHREGHRSGPRRLDAAGA